MTATRQPTPAVGRTAREIPFFNYRGAFASMETELMDTIRDVVRRGAFIMQKDLTDFERACAQYLGVKHAFGVGNATDGLIIAFRSAGLQPGDEVIFPSHTMVASPASVHFAGGIPVPVDIGPDHMLDPKKIEPAITKKTRFIMPVQVNGHHRRRRAGAWLSVQGTVRRLVRRRRLVQLLSREGPGLHRRRRADRDQRRLGRGQDAPAARPRPRS
jgi:hypothetical protein